MNNLISVIKSIPKKLTRVTRSGNFIGEIDGLRFLAIFPVVIQHLSERLIRNTNIDFASNLKDDTIAYLASRGTVGVYIFFAISGFILSLPFAKRILNNQPGPNLKQYFLRRLTRLEPPYILVMTGIFIVLLIKGDYVFSELLPHLGASLLYIHNISYADYPVINPVAWSLEIEIQFYILAPFLAKFIFSIRKKLLRRSIIIGSIFVFITLQHLFSWAHMPFKITILGQLQYFLAGFLVTDIFLNEWQNKIIKRWTWDIIAVVSFYLLLITWSADYQKNLIFIILIFLLLVSVFKSNIVNKVLTSPWIVAIGGMCYTIYLIHLPLMEFLIIFTKKIEFTNVFWINLTVQFCIMAPIILGISIWFYLKVEKPCMDKDWIKKIRFPLIQKYINRILNSSSTSN